MNQNFYEPNLCYNSISSDFDQFQPQQFPVIHQSPQEMSIQDMEDLKQQYLDEMKSLINSEYRNKIKINELKENFNGMSIEINKNKKLQQLKQVANLSTYPSQHFNSFCYDDDDDEDYIIAITPDFSITDSLSMGDEHLSTIPETESDEFIKSSVENLVQNPNLDSTLKNDRFDIKSYLLESLLNHDTLMASSPKFDSLLEEFSGELAHTDLIPPGINEANYDPEEDIHLVERLLYDNSSPRPPKEFNSKNSDAIIESFSPSPIPVEDSDHFVKEINLFLASDGSIPPGIDSDYSDSEGDNLFPERLLHDDPIPFSNILDFSNVVRVFLSFFTYPVTSSILLSSESEDIIFDPGISNYRFSSLEPGVSHRSETFMKFNVYPNHLNESPMEILSSTCFPMDQ
uniref:Reverse transcriptase domain-containing protein n=1 Tax=Tanacetum cinerariifolium TaxID=118510 RepID=A0A699JB78_TANCI|nr:hypothetical protein [Tanacetum cinerariifolium]